MTAEQEQNDRLIAATTHALSTHPAMPRTDPGITYALAVTILQVVLPEHEKQVRKQVAKELNGYAGVPDREWARPVWNTIRTCARIALGGAR